MNEIWNISTSPWVLPFTVLLGFVAFFLVISLLGIIDMDGLDIDADVDGVDADLDLDGDGAGGSFLHAALKIVNAADVPLMMVMSLLSLFIWASSIVWHSIFSWSGLWWGGLLGILVGFIVSCILTRILMVPLKPVFQAFKKGEDDAEPVVGQICEVVSSSMTDKYGRAKVPRRKGSPAVVVCRLAEGEPALEKNDTVIIYAYSKEEKLYLAKKADELLNYKV